MWSQGQAGLWACLAIVLGLVLITPRVTASTAVDLEEFRRQNQDLTEFMTLIVSNPQFKSALDFKQGTIFAPTNTALAEYRQQHPADLNSFTLLYHYTNTPTSHSELEDNSLSTELPGNLPVWITTTDTQYFVNGANILRFDKKVRLGDNSLEQIVHTIDKVLEPTIPVTNVLASKLNNPDAKKYLEFSQDYTISKPYNTSTFARRVQNLNKTDFFQTPGKHTFFLPVSDAFASTRIESVDIKVIEGHMVVGKAIFLRSTQNPNQAAMTYDTSAAAEMFPVKVTVEYSKYTNTWSVMSDNLVADPKAKHRKGKVRAEILKANIPVKNGVVHLISRPLVVIDSDVYKLMQGVTFSGGEKGDGEHGPLQKFFDLIQMFPDVKRILGDTGKDKRVTVFAPSSSVLENSSNFQDMYQKAIKGGPEQAESKAQLEQIVKLHIVPHDITSEVILRASANKTHHFSVKPLATNKQLYFVTSTEADGPPKISVMDGGGTSATIKQGDIGATNGVIHIVNHVLGIGDNTIYDRLKTDPTLTSTYNITQQEGFYKNFKKKDFKFTFFAPFNPAWDGVLYEYPPKHRILFEGHHGRHSKYIMERHLMVGKEKTMEDLYRESVTGNNTIDVRPIGTMRGEIRVVSKNDPNFKSYTEKYGKGHPRKDFTRYHGDYQYVIFWENKEVRVVQGNIKCTNGYLHIIDTVLMTNEDVFVNSARDLLTSPTLNYMSMILLSLLLR